MGAYESTIITELSKRQHHVCKIYPNPSNSFVFFALPVAISGKLTLNIYHSSGILIQTIVSQDNHEFLIKADIKNLAEGIYFYHIITQQTTYKGKFVIAR